MLMHIAKHTAMKCIRYKELVDDEDHERLTRFLTALEKKDDMQQRMESITKSAPLPLHFCSQTLFTPASTHSHAAAHPCSGAH